MRNANQWRSILILVAAGELIASVIEKMVLEKVLTLIGFWLAIGTDGLGKERGDCYLNVTSAGTIL